VGSSGVGKSTLVNSLTDNSGQKTAAIRNDDSKGRHTTTARSMHFIPAGAEVVNLNLATEDQSLNGGRNDIYDEYYYGGG
jgi:GTPase SAR1 family protein